MRDPLPAIKLIAQIMKKIGPETPVNIDNRQHVQADTLILRGLTHEQLAEYLQMHDRLEAMGVIQKAGPESPGRVSRNLVRLFGKCLAEISGGHKYIVVGVANGLSRRDRLTPPDP